jgi:cell division protein FtsX
MKVFWLATVLVVAVCGCTGSSSSESAVRGREVRSIRHPDGEVFMSVAASESDIHAVRTVIRHSHAVRTYAFVTRADAYREFGRLFSDRPELVATTSPEALPVSFRIELATDAKRNQLAQRFGNLAGVDEVKDLARDDQTARLFKRMCARAQRKAPPEFEVFMKVPSTPGERQAVREALSESRRVRSFAFISPRDAYREFSRLLSGEPNLVAATDRHLLPASFRVVLADGTNADRLVLELENLAGVDQAVHTDRNQLSRVCDKR